MVNMKQVHSYCDRKNLLRWTQNFGSFCMPGVIKNIKYANVISIKTKINGASCLDLLMLIMVIQFSRLRFEHPTVLGT